MGRVIKFMEKTNMKSVFCAGAGIQSVLFFLNDGYLPAGRCPNSNFLFPPLAAVVAVASHSIARPTACGSRVPPQRTVLGETPDPQARVAGR